MSRVHYAKALLYKVPAPGQYVRLPSLEVLHEYLKLHDLRVVGWRGDLLVLEKISERHHIAENDDTAEKTPA